MGSPIHHKEEPESGESLLFKRVLSNTTKENQEPVQRRALFKTKYKAKGKCCKLIIDSGSTYNIVSTKMVEKLGLERTKHPTPHRVSWSQKGYQLLVNEEAMVEFQIGSYKDHIVCDIIPMDVCHVLFGRPWQLNRKVMHNVRDNTYTIEKNGIKHTLLPMHE